MLFKSRSVNERNFNLSLWIERSRFHLYLTSGNRINNCFRFPKSISMLFFNNRRLSFIQVTLRAKAKVNLKFVFVFFHFLIYFNWLWSHNYRVLILINKKIISDFEKQLNMRIEEKEKQTKTISVLDYTVLIHNL